MKNLLFTLIATLMLIKTTYAADSDCKNSTDVNLGNGVKMHFCQIPAAVGINIGSGAGDERPIKARYFKSFQISQFEVTQLQYRTLTDENPSKPKSGWNKALVTIGDDLPVVFVSPSDVDLYMRFLNAIDKTAHYRLPTEAEFEYATAAGATTDYFWGKEMNANMAYYIGNSDPTPDTGLFARPVHQCPDVVSELADNCSNQFGLYHMLGNVWEWTADSYSENYNLSPDNGNLAYQAERGSKYQYYRVARGGAWNEEAPQLRTSNRGKARIGQYYNVGFRVVRTPRN